MIKENNSKCYGCESCATKCPFEAIKIEYNNEGFYKPVIDKEKCKNCGICEKFCIIGNEAQYLNNAKQKFYLGYSNDNQLLLNVSSGGIFRHLADFIIANKSYVSGAIFKDGILQHIVTNNTKEIELMSGSKYLQSKINNTFAKVEELLKAKNTVLFSGTPCQVASLKCFLQKEYDNLITVDILCHSVPSSKLFYKYIEEQLGKDSEIVNCTFRDKTKGWHNPILKVITKSKELNNELKNDRYCTAFFNSLISNTSCAECKFANTQRVGDISIGDAWCAQYLFKDFENINGTSLLFINNNKGKKMLNNIKRLIALKEIRKKDAICGNPILQKPFPSHIKRNEFFEEVFSKENSSIEKTIDKFLDISKNVAILNFSFENSNYGAILTAFALNKLLNLSGFNAYNIDYAPNWFNRNNINPDFEKFKNENLPSTSVCEDFEALKNLNNQFDTFIVGSDQVFRPKFASDGNGIYYLNFVKNTKNKIACAASFGVNYYEGDKIDKFKLKYYLSKFNFLSVREDSGISIIKNLINREVFHLLDPVFLLDKQEYINLFKQKNISKNCVVSYILNDNVRKYVNTLNADIKNLRNGLSIEDWLETLYNAKIVITDSFHAICFSLIFNKPFVVIVDGNCPVERILSLFRFFNINHNKIMFFNPKLTYDEILSNIINPSDIQDSIEILSKKHKEIFLEKVKKKNYIKKPIIHLNKKKIKKIKRKYKLLKMLSFGKLRKIYSNKIKHADMLKDIINFENNN